MNFRVATTGLLCLLAACSAPFHAPDGGNSFTDAVRSDSAVGFSASDLPSSPSPQYSPDQLFMKKHGEFMLRREPWRPNLTVSMSTMSDAEIKHADGDFNLVQTNAGLEGKVYTDDDAFLNLGAIYHQRDYTFSGAAGADDDMLTRASVNLGFGYFLDDSTLLEIDMQPGVYSDFSGTLHHGDWQIYGTALVTWKYGPNIYVKAGAEYSGLFRDTEGYPLLGVGLAIQNNFRFDLLAPRYARLTADLSQDSSLNLSLDLGGNEYQIRPPQSSVHRTIHIQELELSLGGYHRFSKVVSLHARVGTTLLGDYTWRNTSADIYKGTLEPQMFAEVGFGWSF